MGLPELSSVVINAEFKRGVNLLKKVEDNIMEIAIDFFVTFVLVLVFGFLIGMMVFAMKEGVLQFFRGDEEGDKDLFYLFWGVGYFGFLFSVFMCLTIMMCADVINPYDFMKNAAGL